jgi:hypothetical protein
MARLAKAAFQAMKKAADHSPSGVFSGGCCTKGTRLFAGC